MRFEELDLPIGKSFTMKLVGLDYKSHEFEGQLIGHQKGKNIAITIPAKPGQVLLQAGATVSVSATSPEGSLWFEADIEYIHDKPFLYLLLEYPLGIEFERKRKEARFPVDTPIEIFGHTGLGMKTSAIHGYMLDVSENGCRLVLEKELTSMIIKIDIGVNLSEQGLERNMTLVGEMRNKSKPSKDYPGCTFAYGIEFKEIEDVDKLFLKAYCLQEIVNEKSLLC